MSTLQNMKDGLNKNSVGKSGSDKDKQKHQEIAENAIKFMQNKHLGRSTAEETFADKVKKVVQMEEVASNKSQQKTFDKISVMLTDLHQKQQADRSFYVVKDGK